MKKLFTSIIIIMFVFNASCQDKQDSIRYHMLTIVNMSEKAGHVGQLDFGNGKPLLEINNNDAGKIFETYMEVLNYVCNKYHLRVESCTFTGASKTMFLLKFEPRKILI
jgi:hypothetical protein